MCSLRLLVDLLKVNLRILRGRSYSSLKGLRTLWGSPSEEGAGFVNYSDNPGHRGNTEARCRRALASLPLLRKVINGVAVGAGIELYPHLTAVEKKNLWLAAKLLFARQLASLLR